MSLINSVGLKSLWNTTKTVAKHYEYMAVDPIYISKLQKSMKNGESTSKCFKDAYAVTEARAKGRNVFKRVWDSLKGIGRDYKNIKSTVASAGKLSFFKKVGKYLAPIGKRMPMIGNLMAIGFAIPNIISAFKDGGFGTGIKETVKEAAKLGIFAIGAAVGTAVGGPIGGIVGGIALSWVGDKLLGERFVDKKAEAEAQALNTSAGAAPQVVQHQENTQPETTVPPVTQNETTVQNGQYPQVQDTPVAQNPGFYPQMPPLDLTGDSSSIQGGFYPQAGFNPQMGFNPMMPYASQDLMALGTFGNLTGTTFPQIQKQPF